MITITQIKQLRKETGVSIIECKKALEKAKGKMAEAKEILRKQGQELVEEKKEKEVHQGIIESYVHPNKKIGVLLDIRCETDFVARSEEFKKLAHELCLQIAAMDSQKTSLMSQPWIRDETKKVKDLIDEYIAKLGENIIVEKFIRYEI